MTLGNESASSILNKSGFLPGDVLFITRRGGSTLLNLAAQRAKRWAQRSREPFVGYAHVALAIGQDQVVHSTVSAKGTDQPQGVVVQSIYELAPHRAKRWEVLRLRTQSASLASIRDASLAYIGFAYNGRFDLKQVLPSAQYDFAVYCSEFIAAVFCELELVDKALTPHKVTPNLLHDTLLRGGWGRVPNDAFNFEVSPEWDKLASQNAALQFNMAKQIVGQTINTSSLLAQFLGAHRKLVDLDRDGSLSIQEYHRVGSGSLIGLPVTWRVRLAMSQLGSMAFGDDFAVSVDSDTGTSAPIAAAPSFRLKQWAELALRAQVLKSYSRMVDHYFAFEANVVAELAANVHATLAASEGTDSFEGSRALESSLENLYRSASVLSHHFRTSDVMPQYQLLAERFKQDGYASPFWQAFGFLTLLLNFYVSIESLLLKSGSVVLGRLDVTPEVVACLKGVASAYEHLEPYISINMREDKAVVTVAIAIQTAQAAETMIGQLRKSVAALGTQAAQI